MKNAQFWWGRRFRLPLSKVPTKITKRTQDLDKNAKRTQGFTDK